MRDYEWLREVESSAPPQPWPALTPALDEHKSPSAPGHIGYVALLLEVGLWLQRGPFPVQMRTRHSLLHANS